MCDNRHKLCREIEELKTKWLTLTGQQVPDNDRIRRVETQIKRKIKKLEESN